MEYELSDGELIVTAKSGAWHELVKSNILTELFGYEGWHCEAGMMFAESLFQLGPWTARMPEGAFLSAAKVALLPDADVVIPVVPDLAVEVISEWETAAGAEKKVREYLAAGVREVWQVYPWERSVRIRLRGRVYDLTGDEILETAELPGFSVKVSAFFVRYASGAKPAAATYPEESAKMIGMGTKTALTPADLLAMPDDDSVEYEVSDGELIVMGKAGMWHELVKRRIMRRLFAYEEQHPEIGQAFGESLFQLGPRTARMPDAAFLGAAKVALLSDANIVIPVVPDLVVEVISESETAASAETKVREYLAAGVREVWQFYPRGRRVRVHLPDRLYDLTGDEILETPVLPGFSVKVSAFFA